MEETSDKDKDHKSDRQKSKGQISAKTMLEQRKRAVTHNNRMQNYNQQNALRRQTMQETKKQNAFVLYDLKDMGLLQGGDSESSAADNNYAFDFSDDEEREIEEEKKVKKLSKEEQDKVA